MKKVLFLLAGLTLFAASCTKNGENEAQNPATDGDFSSVPVRVEPLITRASETDFEVGDEIGLTITRESGVYAANQKLTYDGTTFSGSLKWFPEGSTKATLAAYYPYAAAVPTSFTVAADQSVAGALSASDFLSSVKTDVLPSTNAIAMVFQHRLSRIVITVVNNSGSAIDAITLKGVNPTATIDADLSASAAGEGTPADVKTACVAEKYYAILPPQTVAMKAAVTYLGKTREQQMTEAELLPGKQYSVTIVVNPADIKVILAGEIENWSDGGEISGDAGETGDGEHLDEGYIIYAGARYSVKQLSNGRWLMTQSLRYVPEGKTISEDPSDGNGIWYPYTSDGSTVTVDKSEEAIEARGLIYDHQVAFASEITAENFKSFEGTRGICPKGWHIPTHAEWFAIVGASNRTDDAAAAQLETAIYYDEEYKAARIKTMNADGFNWDFAGSVMRNSNTATGKYQATITKATTCSIADWVGRNAITYYMGSTGYTPANTATNRQFLSVMSTFTSVYSEGKASLGYSNYLAGCSLRCIRDAE